MNIKIVKFFSLGMLLLLLVSCHNDEAKESPSVKRHYTKEKIQEPTAIFINDYLVAPSGLIKTDIKEREEEFLSESMGLWLTYLLQTNDEENFKVAVQAVEENMLLKTNIISWELKGNTKSETNALLDDLRVVEALYRANEKWQEVSYGKLAKKIADANRTYAMKNDYFVDFASESKKHRTNTMTISYITPSQLQLLAQNNVISKEQYETNMDVLRHVTIDKNGFFAKQYEIDSERYSFEKQVHMIDQFLIAINRQSASLEVKKFTETMKKTFLHHDKLYGQYERETVEPSVNFESPAVYALAIAYFETEKEFEVAKKLRRKMLELRVNEKGSKLYGGYVNEESKDTHAFDNLMPIVMEGRKSE